jgi:hypothetical protein
MSGDRGATSLDITRTTTKEHLMYSQQIIADMAAAHRRDLFAEADARRLARQVRRTERRTAVSRHSRRPWIRPSIRPAHS